MDDIITELKTENFDRPNKDVVYVFSFILLLIFGYFNYTNYRIRKNQNYLWYSINFLRERFKNFS